MPVYENSMMEPLVMESSRRRNDTSCGARPGAVCEEALICEMRIARPVKVASTRRWIRCLDPVNFNGAGPGAVVMLDEAVSGEYVCAGRRVDRSIGEDEERPWVEVVVLLLLDQKVAGAV